MLKFFENDSRIRNYLDKITENRLSGEKLLEFFASNKDLNNKGKYYLYVPIMLKLGILRLTMTEIPIVTKNYEKP